MASQNASRCGATISIDGRHGPVTGAGLPLRAGGTGGAVRTGMVRAGWGGVGSVMAPLVRRKANPWP